MQQYLTPWFEEIKAHGGLASLSTQIGDYNILYQTIIALMTYLDIPCIYQYKFLSIVFDFVLAIGVAYFIAYPDKSSNPLADVQDKETRQVQFNLAYTIVLFLPTVVLNSAYWGQCDSIFTSLLVLFMAFLHKKKFLSAFTLYGIAFAFKFQSILLLPFVICYYFYKKDFSIGWLFVSIVVFYLCNSIGLFYGRTVLEPFEIYFSQTETYSFMYLNIHSFWMLIGDNYEHLKSFALICTLILCGIGLYLILSGKKKLDTHEQFLHTAAWFLWTCILFLPAMHERYTYALDIVLLMLCFKNSTYVKYAALSILLSCITYGGYLFHSGTPEKVGAFLYVISWVHFSTTILRSEKLPPHYRHETDIL